MTSMALDVAPSRRYQRDTGRKSELAQSPRLSTDGPDHFRSRFLRRFYSRGWGTSFLGARIKTTEIQYSSELCHCIRACRYKIANEPDLIDHVESNVNHSRVDARPFNDVVNRRRCVAVSSSGRLRQRRRRS